MIFLYVKSTLNSHNKETQSKNDQPNYILKRKRKLFIDCQSFTYIHCQSYTYLIISNLDFPGGSLVKNLPVNAGDVGLIPGSGRCPEVGNGNPLWYSCLGNPLDRGAWWATVHGHKRVEHNLGTKQKQKSYVQKREIFLLGVDTKFGYNAFIIMPSSGIKQKFSPSYIKKVIPSRNSYGDPITCQVQD